MARETDDEFSSAPNQFDESNSNADESIHSDFEEIRHCGGKLAISPEGGLKFSHSSPLPASIHILCFSFNGFFLGLVQPWGMGGPVPAIPTGAIFVHLFSDAHGLFGRWCPKCKKYFRTSSLSDNMFCVYCDFRGSSGSFMTENQTAFVKSYLATVADVISNQEEIEIDIDKIIADLPDNKKSPFAYSEQRQQTLYTCSKCEVRYDILGEYGRCPFCGRLNSLGVFRENLSTLNERVQYPRFTPDQRQERENEWVEIQGRCFSIFEGYCNDLRRYLLYIQATPQRKKKLKDQSFQRIIEANELVKEVADIDFLSGMSESDVSFLNKTVNQRHIFTHRNGIVDTEYLERTGDSSVRLGEKIRLRKKEVGRLAELLGAAATSYDEGLQSIMRSDTEDRNPSKDE